MTANTFTESVVKLPAYEFEHLSGGTSYEPQDDLPLQAAHPDLVYEPLAFEVEAGRPQRATENAAALRQVAIEVFAEPRLTDPDTLYVERVFSSLIDQLLKAGRISVDEYDLLSSCHRDGTRNAAHAVAAAWLDERGSLPIAKAGGAK